MNITNRPDGREPGQFRIPSVQFRTITKAHGSAEFGLGDEQCIACIYGPINKLTRRDINDRVRIEVLYRSCCTKATPKERNHEMQIKRYLEKVIDVKQYPRCTLRLVVHPTVPDNGEVVSSHALNSAFLACLDAGVAMKTSCFAFTVGIRAEDDVILIDPVREELGECSSLLVLGVAKGGEICYVSQISYLTETIWNEVIRVAVKAEQVLEAFTRLSAKATCANI